MRILLIISIILAAIVYFYYQRIKTYFSQLAITYTITSINNGVYNNQLSLKINIVNPNDFSFKITNPEITILDGNNNLIVLLDLLDENKNVYLVKGNNQYTFKIKDKLLFINPISLINIKIFFSATIYGIKLNKQIN